jgi:inner membrane protein
VDNLCHTLVGAACAEAGLKRRTRFATAALLVAANLPDIDVLVFATGMPSVAFRRGWTHGVIAQVLLPVLLTGACLLADRLRPRRADDEPPVHAGWLLALSVIGIYSHVFLDFLNNYGVRLLAPFDWRWFYGDAVFIVDPWLWLSLGAGVWLSRRQDRPTAARGSLVFASLYVAVMLASAQAARGAVAAAWGPLRGVPASALASPRSLMVGPVAVSPLTRVVIVDAGDHYETGTFSWRTNALTMDAAPIPKNGDRPAVRAARGDAGIQAVLTWSRFPFWRLEPAHGGVRVTLQDVRFAGGPGAGLGGSVVVPGASTRLASSGRHVQER